eukprot:TRINITY_DN67506_c0_g1_i1.p1 TRINITY_DN67506_c0_g1~~TRINITY_DN67506_c0_g1_i1.p1  ORF type:complete len:395 (+),score=35.52 TRINITY_DN67506_c0_g1_i1:107-1186(+)
MEEASAKETHYTPRSPIAEPEVSAVAKPPASEIPASARTGRRPVAGSYVSMTKVQTPGLGVDRGALTRIADRYYRETVKAESKRRAAFAPVEKCMNNLHSFDEGKMAKEVKMDLDRVIQRTGGTTLAGLPKHKDSWLPHVEKVEFQKRSKWLYHNMNNGTYIEQYGNTGQYEGDFMNGMRHGNGTHTWSGEVYEGQWRWDNRHGWGSLRLADGSSVKGDWERGKPHGFATMTDAEGKITYEGEFKNGKRHGLGRQLFESGDMYDGGWADGYLSDRGVYYYTNGDKLYGIWERGQYHGPCVFHYADGSVSRRTYSKGVLQSAQDYAFSQQRFAKEVKRPGMHSHTRDKTFPRELYMPEFA